MLLIKQLLRGWEIFPCWFFSRRGLTLKVKTMPQLTILMILYQEQRRIANSIRFWDLKKLPYTKLCQWECNGSLLRQKSPTCTYISQKLRQWDSQQCKHISGGPPLQMFIVESYDMEMIGFNHISCIKDSWVDGDQMSFGSGIL